MKLAIIGSRNITVENLEDYIPKNLTEIVSGGAKGVDSCAMQYAQEHNIKLIVFLPKYKLYGKAAPLKRNLQIIDYSDEVFAFWDGQSKGTKYVIDNCRKINKKVTVITIQRKAPI
ncbi:MAG: DUF2493 domain-containing protein [Lachnospiraceae bacterium]|nr:DUF2493 domain-containing protein [Lachnospiraceae bacterium]